MDSRDLIELMTNASAGSLVERMQIVLLEVSAQRVVGRMPVAGNTQPYGLLHGGANVVLAETLGSIASQINAGRDKATVGIEVSATHHRAARSGFVTGVATPIHVGRTTMTFEIVIADDDGKRTCTSRLTCLVRDAPPGG